MTNYREMLALDNGNLPNDDPLVRNLLLAKSIPALANLDIPRYQNQADAWAAAIRLRLPRDERAFHKTPRDWKNDINFFRLGVVCSFVETELGVKYHEEQREVTQIRYTNPSDLF